MTAAIALCLLGSVTSASAEKWVDTGLHVLVDLDSIRRDADGLVHFNQRILDMRKNPLPVKPSAYDCSKGVEYSSTRDASWRSRGFQVTPDSLGSDLLKFVCARAPRAAPSAQPGAASPSGEWRGTWVNRMGYVYDATLRIRIAADGTLEGNIQWTLRTTPIQADQHKVGMTAVEQVRGAYDARNGTISFRGFEKNDPNEVIGLDRYRLFYAENGKVIGGITENHGTWEGVFSLVRAG